MLAEPANTITLGVNNPPLGLTTTAAKSDQAGSASADGLFAGLPIWAWVLIVVGALAILIGIVAAMSKQSPLGLAAL